jgi:hypothetical protein
MKNNPFRDPPQTPPTLLEDGLEFAPDENLEFQTGSGVIIAKVRFSEMREHGFLNIVRKIDGMVMCQIIQRCDEHKIEELLNHTQSYKRADFISGTEKYLAK